MNYISVLYDLLKPSDSTWKGWAWSFFRWMIPSLYLGGGIMLAVLIFSSQWKWNLPPDALALFVGVLVFAGIAVFLVITEVTLIFVALMGVLYLIEQRHGVSQTGQGTVKAIIASSLSPAISFVLAKAAFNSLWNHVPTYPSQLAGETIFGFWACVLASTGIFIFCLLRREQARIDASTARS